MSKKIKEINGVKIIRRHSVGSVFMFLFCFAMAAIPVVMYFLPFIVIKDVGSAENPDIVMTGKNLLFSLLGKRFTDLDTFVQLIDAASPADYIYNVYNIGLYVAAGAYILSAIFALILVIVGLSFLFRGRVNHFKLPVGLAWWMTFLPMLIIFIFELGLKIFLDFMIKNGISDAIKLNYNIWYPIIYFGSSFIIAVIISIVYAAAFKNKVYIGDVDDFLTSYKFEGGKNKVYDQPVAAAPVSPIINITNTQPTPVQSTVKVHTTSKNATVKPDVGLPKNLLNIGGHAFSENLQLTVANIPVNVTTLGVGAFANCLNLKQVNIPKSVKKIGRNCFFNCAKLKRINYTGTKEDWRHIVRGSNWLLKAGTTVVVCKDGSIFVNPYQ